jgi:hypothetical protein
MRYCSEPFVLASASFFVISTRLPFSTKEPMLAEPSQFERLFGWAELYLLCLQHENPKKA